MAFKPVTHVIFDCDGLLLDTESIHKKLNKDIARTLFNKEFTDDYHVKILGRTEQESFKIIVEGLELKCSPQCYMEHFYKHCYPMYKDCELMPGVEKLLKHLSKHNIPIAVATSSGKDTMNIKTAKHKSLFNLFHHIVMGSSDPEVKVGKPSPDIYLICASRFPDSPNPAQCLVFEDAPNGVQAAVSAGMQCVMVPDPQLDKQLQSKATFVINSLENFDPTTFGLPSFN